MQGSVIQIKRSCQRGEQIPFRNGILLNFLGRARRIGEARPAQHGGGRLCARAARGTSYRAQFRDRDAWRPG